MNEECGKVESTQGLLKLANRNVFGLMKNIAWIWSCSMSSLLLIYDLQSED